VSQLTDKDPPDELTTLLQATEAILSKQPSNIEDNEKVLWVYSNSNYECLQCHRTYHGQLFHPTIQEPKKRYVAWCPKCIDEKLWWLHQNFTVVSIEKPINGPD